MSALMKQYGEDCVTFINGDERLDNVKLPNGHYGVRVINRVDAAEQFNEGRVRFLISTEAGGEGIDLQHQCYSLIHVDLPWNPMRLHQRVGRLNRYGQEHAVDVVTIRNGVSTRASQVAATNANTKYLDFVICDRTNMKLLGAIDLVDTQGKGYKIKKDWFVSGALEAAVIPHIRIKVKANYTIDEIRTCINSRLLGNNTPLPKVKGKVIPAPMIKARPRNVGAIATKATKEQIAPQMARQNPARQAIALTN